MGRVKKQIKIMTLCLVMYAIHFLIVPAAMYAVDLMLEPFITSNRYPSGDEAYFILYVSAFCIPAIGMYKVSGCIIYWLIGDILYCLMVFIYHPAGAYGIGQRGMFAATVSTRETDIFDLICMFVLVAVAQIIAEIVVAIIKFVRKLMMKDSDSTIHR